MIRLISTLLFIFTSMQAFAQLGGDNIYNFLRLNSSARLSALGGHQIAVKDNDPFLAAENPSLLNEEMDNKLALTYMDYFSDINFGYVSYTKHYDSIGTFNAGLKYIDYGQFTETDISGNELGTFSAGEYAFIIGYSRPLDTNFTIGANLKTIYSSLYDYNSVGIAADLGLTYYSDKRKITLAIVAKNFGTQIQTYTEDNREALPFELQIGFTKRLKRVPLRIGVIAQQLQKWDLTYENPNELIEEDGLLNQGSDNTNDNNQDEGFFENVKRRLIFNAEFLLTDNFNIRLGYNYFRRRELRIDDKLGAVGFSFGFGMRISKFHISYGRSNFHQAGGTNTFSISTRLSDFVN